MHGRGFGTIGLTMHFVVVGRPPRPAGQANGEALFFTVGDYPPEDGGDIGLSDHASLAFTVSVPFI